MSVENAEPHMPRMNGDTTEWLKEVEMTIAKVRGVVDRVETMSPMLEGQTVDPLRMARQLVSIYRRRNLLFAELGASELFGDPAWNMLVDLFIETKADRRVSISSLCIGSMAPQTTALRHIALLVAKGVLIRTPDEQDNRRIFVSLAPAALTTMEKLLAEYSFLPFRG